MGVVKAITDEQAVTTENIDQILETGQLAVREKQDEQLVYDRPALCFLLIEQTRIP